MPRNHRKKTTVTRSISFRDDVFAALETQIAQCRSDRSKFINGVLEHVMGFMPHPELLGRNAAFTPRLQEDEELNKLPKSNIRKKAHL